MSWDFDAPAGPFPTEDVEDDSFDDWPSSQAKEDEGGEEDDEAMLNGLMPPASWNPDASFLFWLALDLVRISPPGHERKALVAAMETMTEMAKEEDEDDS